LPIRHLVEAELSGSAVGGAVELFATCVGTPTELGCDLRPLAPLCSPVDHDSLFGSQSIAERLEQLGAGDDLAWAQSIAQRFQLLRVD